MNLRRCTCGAEASLRETTRVRADGQTETLYWIGCPVCGQPGPMISDFGKDRETAIAEAVAGWNEMIARLRPV